MASSSSKNQSENDKKELESHLAWMTFYLDALICSLSLRIFLATEGSKGWQQYVHRMIYFFCISNEIEEGDQNVAGHDYDDDDDDDQNVAGHDDEDD